MNIKKIGVVLVLGCLPLMVQSDPQTGNSAAVPIGYSAASALTEAGWEKKLRDIVDAGHIRENMRRLTARIRYGNCKINNINQLPIFAV